jgi:hypothetical protein
MSFTPNYISQRDPGWINENLGFDTTVTIGTDGSTLTCLTMLVNGYGFTETPSTMNRKLKELGSGVGFLGSLIVWPGLTQAFPKIVYRGIIICRDQPAPISDINASLDAGQPLVIEIDGSPSVGLQNHWVVIYARQGDDYLMLDPWPQPPDHAPTSLASRYGLGRPMSEFITAVAWYDASGSPAPGTGLYVRVQAALAAGLTLRSASIISATAVAVEPPGTLLHCNEPDAVVLPRIGVMDQWLHVSDPAGLDGYVAAWNVDKVGGAAPTPVPAQVSTPQPEPAHASAPVPTPQPAPAPAPTPPPQPVPAPAVLTVLVLQSIGAVGLRLRDQPDVNSNTLTILSAGQELTVLEPAGQAIPKIGQINQWLNVSDGDGHIGYVAAWYVEPGNTPSSVRVPQPSPASAALTVLVSSQASAGLRMRDQPDANGIILKVLMPGTPMTVLEPASTAQAKIGVVNQWLNVQEPGGTTGYVAARYVIG